MAKTPKKALARGKRKSIVDQYKAKARGKKTSQPLKPGSKKKPNTSQSKYNPVLSMVYDGREFQAGDIAWYVLEGAAHSKRPRSGEIKECHPTDKTAVCVTVIDHGFKHYRAIRADLIGWNKAEAKKRWEDFKDHPHYRG